MRHARAVLWMVFLAAPTAAQTTVYQCTAADGTVSFQDAPCPRRQHQRTLQMQTPPPPPAVAASAPIAPAPAPAATAPPVADDASRQRMPPPQLYQCQRATDGKTYVSRNGQPGAYLVPSGILSYAQPLADAYGGRGGGGASAPELNRGRVTPGMIGGTYVWVQDQCRPMTFGEICAHLQKAYDENDAKLRNAFRSDRGPFEQREKQLRSEMEACVP